MSADFLQPEGGKVNGNDMIFEFSGDDDVWVYVDGVLVLDIGGIHNAISGSINFATGAVKVGKQTDTNLKTLFENANADTSDYKGNKFADYTGHTINFYYLERGKGASNCHLKFNLTTMPEGTVAVEKQLSNTDKEKYANVEFKFQLLAQKILSTDPQSGKETYSENEYVPLGSAVLNDGNNTSIVFNDETINDIKYENVFTLKPGQRAIFSGLKKNRKYKVQEIGVKSTEYDKILINKVEVKDQQCSVEIHLHCPGLPENVKCNIYGFTRKDGLINGILLDTCETEKETVECLIITDATDMNDSGVAMGKLGGMIITSDTGGFFGTEWDDQPIRPENFHEIKTMPDADIPESAKITSQ